MALGTGIRGLQKLLGLSRNAMEELLSSDVDNARQFLTPDQFSILSNEMAKVRRTSDTLPMQLTELGRLSDEQQAIGKEAAAYGEAEEFAWDPSKSYAADASGSPSDIFGINRETGLPVYAQYGAEDALEGAKEILMEHPGFGAVDAFGQRIKQVKGSSYAKGTEVYRAEGQLDTPMSGEFLKKLEAGPENLNDHLKALRHNILDTVLQKPPVTDKGLPKSGTALEWVPGTNRTPGHWNPFEVTEEESAAILENTHNLAANFNRLGVDDWEFIDQSLNEARVTSDLWKKYTKTGDRAGRGSGPGSWFWGHRPSSADAGYTKLGEAESLKRYKGIKEAPTDVKRFKDDGDTRPLENWKGEESLVLRNVLQAIDNAVDAKANKALFDDPRSWYHLGQLQDDYKEMWGEVVGTRLFLDFVNMIGASTAGAFPAKNFQMASYYDWLNFHKQLFTGQPIRMQGDGLPMGVGKTSTYTYREDFKGSEIGDQWFSREEFDLVKKHFDDLDVAAKRKPGTSWKKIWSRAPVKSRKEEGPQLLDKLWLGIDEEKYGSLMSKKNMEALYKKADLANLDLRPDKGNAGKQYWNPNYGPKDGARIPRLPIAQDPTGKEVYFDAGGLSGHIRSKTHQTNILRGVRKTYKGGEFEQPDWILRLIKGASMLDDKQIGGKYMEEISRLFRLDPLTATKGAHFAAALSGNLQAVTMDKVMTRTLLAKGPTGKVLDAPADNTYAYLAEFIADIAKGYDMDPSALQAVVWLGTQDKSQVAGMGSSAIRTLDERIRITTAFLNKSLGKDDGGRFTVDQVKNLVLKKVIPALGVVPGINLGLDPEGELTDAEKEDL